MSLTNRQLIEELHKLDPDATAEVYVGTDFSIYAAAYCEVEGMAPHYGEITAIKIILPAGMGVVQRKARPCR